MKAIEITPKATYFILSVMFFLYIALSFGELFVPECTGLTDCYDFNRRMARIAVWDIDWITDDFRHVIHLGLLVFSEQVFGNAKFLVLVSSVLLLGLTYLLTINLTGKRIAGVVACLIVISSNIFRTYDTSVTYPSFWATLYIFSLYLITTKFWASSFIPYVISIPAKAITPFFYPSTLAFILFSDCQTKKTKLITLAIFLSVLLFGVILLLIVNTVSSATSGGFLLVNDFRLNDFVGGFFSWMWKGFADDQITLMMLFVFGFMVFMNRKVIRNSKPVLALLVGMIMISPILIGMTTYDVWTYRQVPLVIVVGILGGMIVAFADKINWNAFKLSKA